MSGVKLLMSWDIPPGNEEQYFEFHIRRFIPSLDKMGLKLNEAWLTVYGEHPRMTAEAMMNNVSDAQKVLNSTEWDDLGRELNDLVENFSCKIIPARRGFQL